MGWLTGDVVLGSPLIEHKDAHAVGRKIGKRATKGVHKYSGEFAAPSRRVGKRKFAGSDAAEQRATSYLEAEREEARLRQERVDLPLPERPQQPVPITNSRNRVEAPPALPPPVPPAAPPATPSVAPKVHDPLDELKAIALRVLESLLVAEGSCAAARRAHQHALQQYDRAKLDCGKEMRFNVEPDANQDKWEQSARGLAESRERRLATLRALNDAELALFDAQFASDEAKRDVQSEEMARAHARQRDRELEAQLDLMRRKHEQIVMGLQSNARLDAWLASRGEGPGPRPPPDFLEYQQLLNTWELVP
eukprot:6906707-Prymnesium_polylepis.1